MTNGQRKQLQTIQTDKAWEAVEDYIQEYIENYLPLSQSIKRDSEFNTVWDRAFSEGGKHHLMDFFNKLEAEARKYEIQ
jgi:hypothetical protein